MPEILTPEQTAKYLNLNTRTVYNALQSGEIPGRKIGRRWRIAKAALDAWLVGDMAMEDYLLQRIFGDEIAQARQDYKSGQGVSLDDYLED